MSDARNGAFFAKQAEGLAKDQATALVPKSTGALGKPGLSGDLISEARKYATPEEFVRAQGTTVYRGEFNRPQGTISGVKSTSLNPQVAKNFSGSGKIDTYIIPSSAKVVDISTLRKEILGVTKLPNPSTLTEEQIQSITGKNLVDYARSRGYDVIDKTKVGMKSYGISQGNAPLDEQEMQIVNESILKTYSQLTELWKKAWGKK